MANPHRKPAKPGCARRWRVRRPANLQNPNSPIFNQLTVVWVQTNGVPFDTTGFTARLFRKGTLVQTAAFDRFGVVRFSRVATLTRVSYTLRLFDAGGTLFRTRTIPAGVETFAVIG